MQMRPIPPPLGAHGRAATFFFSPQVKTTTKQTRLSHIMKKKRKKCVGLGVKNLTVAFFIKKIFGEHLGTVNFLETVVNFCAPSVFPR